MWSVCSLGKLLVSFIFLSVVECRAKCALVCVFFSFMILGTSVYKASFYSSGNFLVHISNLCIVSPFGYLPCTCHSISPQWIACRLAKLLSSIFPDSVKCVFQARKVDLILVSSLFLASLHATKCQVLWNRHLAFLLTLVFFFDSHCSLFRQTSVTALVELCSSLLLLLFSS